MAEGMPLSEALKGSLYGEGYAYQFAARFSSPAFLLGAAWLGPTVSYGNRVMFTEVITRAMEARHRMMGAGPSEKWGAETRGGGDMPWAFNAVLGNVAGAILFRIVANESRDDAGMLRVRLAGVAPDMGGYHSAFPSDCLPWSTSQGNFVINAEVSYEDRAATCERLVTEWKCLGQEAARGDRSGRARWVPGCPVRVARGGVGGNRLLLLTPGPVTWELRPAATANLRNVNLASLAEVDKLNNPFESW